MDQLDTATVSRFIRPLEDRFSDELLRAIAEMQADAETQARYDYLADGRNQGTLTPQEETELASLVQTSTVFGLMKAEAQARLKSKGK